jgi:hypothetical protein
MHPQLHIFDFKRRGQLHILPSVLIISLSDRDSQLPVLGPHQRR